MRFSASLERVMANTKGFTPVGTTKPFIFTRSKILFTKNHKEETYYLGFKDENLAGGFKNGSQYLFDKEYDKDDNRRFKITLQHQYPYGTYLRINFWNRFKCNVLHKRYWVQKPENRDKIYVGIITGVVGGLILFLLTRWIK